MADLYNLLAWTEFDTGRTRQARRHFAVAAELAAESGNADLASNIFYRLGRLHLHHGHVTDALAQFDRGQDAARRAGSSHAQAILSANQAWAHAMQADQAAALRDLNRAEEAFATAAGSAAPWAVFFDANDLAAMTGTVHIELARTVDTGHAARAIPSLAVAVAGYGPQMTRSLSLTQILLALGHALEHNFDDARRVGTEALRTAGTVRSVRTADRLRPLAAAVRDGSPDAAGRDLIELIRAFRERPFP
ncbi:hypothetical protein ACIA5G_53440 [Amycolatopsis sp. NPDC051758]|uniref:hypothetical protein n=1 Tax=Amycolatopsis sp. NPDC051758 TaxID=3363935 RepID=UPI0037B6F1D1